jgi:hypothetical protein
MSISIASIPKTNSANSIIVPDSSSFIGSVEDAVALQLIVLTSVSDRFRETIRSELTGAEKLIASFEALADRLNQFGQLVKGGWKPVTYDALTSSEKDATSLKTLFSSDGPNLGNTLEESESMLSALKSDGISLDAPKQTPVMIESFAAVNGKVDFSGKPALSSVSWKSDQELQVIDPGTTTGSYPGSVVKTIETRDSSNKLISVTRYTVFSDYSNLRPKPEDLQLSVSLLQQKLLPLLTEFESALSRVQVKQNLLDDRMRDEMSKVADDQKVIGSIRQSQSDDLRELLRLLKVYRIDLENRINRFEKNMPDDSENRKNLLSFQDRMSLNSLKDNVSEV